MTGLTDVELILAQINQRKADKNTTYTITEIDTALDLKENKSDTFTYNVSVENNKYLIDGEFQPTLDLFNGNTYIFDMSFSIPENFIKFSTTPNGPTEYTEGVTSTELFETVETTMTFSDLLFNGVKESIEKIELKNINNFPQVPDIINRHNRLFHRVPSSIPFVDRQLYFVSFFEYNSNSRIRVLQSRINQGNDDINYSNNTFGVWEKITIVKKNNGYYTLKNIENNVSQFNGNPYCDNQSNNCKNFFDSCL